MPRIIIIIGFLFCFFSILAQQNRLFFEPAPPEIGLAHTSTVNITQDHHGFMWFCTYLGLFRYDGQNTVQYTYSKKRKGSLSSNKTFDILSTKDQKLYVATLLGGLMEYNYDLDQFEHIGEPGAHSLRNNMWSLYEDRSGTIWCGTEKGIALLEPDQVVLRNDDAFEKSEINNRKVNFMDPSGTDYIWIGTDDGLYVFHHGSDGKLTELGSYIFDFNGFTREQTNFISKITPTSDPNDQKVLVFNKAGIVEFDFALGFNQTTSSLIYTEGSKLVFPRDITTVKDPDYEYFIGTNQGLLTFNKYGEVGDENYLQELIIRSLYKDHFGTIWVGTESGLYLQRGSNPLVENHLFKNNLSFKRELIETMEVSPISGDLWIAWQNGSLSRIPKTDSEYLFDNISNHQIKLKNGNILKDRISMMKINEGGQIYMVSQGSGLLIFDEVNHTPVIITQEEYNTSNIMPDDYLMSIAMGDEYAWIGTWKNGVIEFDLDSKQIRPIEEGGRPAEEWREYPVMRLINCSTTSGEFLAVGTSGEGLFLEGLDGKERIHLHDEAVAPYTLNNNFITSLDVKDDRLSIGSENGIDIFDFSEMKILDIKESDELNDFLVQGLCAVDYNKIWLTTSNHGIYEIVIDSTMKIGKYAHEGIIDQYVMSPGIIMTPQKIAFAGNRGITVINHEASNTSDITPIPIITALAINNETYDANNKDHQKISASHIVQGPKLSFDHTDKVISFQISAVHTSNEQPLNYAYRLDGFHTDWVYTDNREKWVHFTNLSYKDYTFYFKTSIAGKDWSEPKIVHFSISPPWYQSMAALFLYAGILVAIMYGAYRIIRIRNDYRSNLRLAEIDREKSEELNRLKLEFYTAISHELRTPLTMIIAPLEQLMKTTDSEQKSKSLQFIHRNAEKLLKMVNQLLDIRKLDANKAVLHTQKFDLIEFINEVISSHKSLASQKDIRIKFEHEEPILEMIFDEDELEKVFSNLITNAVKYSDSEKSITIRVEKMVSSSVKIEVEDQGYGIHEKKLPYIFDRYYQAEEHKEEGYGLGLSIVRSIVELHEGSISATSRLGEGTVFTIHLPTDLALSPKRKVDSYRKLIDPTESIVENVLEKEPTTLLIVEDSPDIKEFLRENLQVRFKILMASNGQEGLEIATEQVPDLIITDIAMPKMDGLEMCKNLKNNPATSHIPVIVLTARTSMNFKLQGYEYGINAFVTKPFNLELLNKQIDATLDYLDILKEKYADGIMAMDDGNMVPRLPEVNSGDKEFVQAITDFILQEIGNSQLAVEDIARAINMSQVQFYRKLKAIMGTTPKKLMREIRLQRAMQLLVKTDLNISEVTYAVGFNDLKYFRTKFKEKFEVNPSEVEKDKSKRIEIVLDEEAPLG